MTESLCGGRKPSTVAIVLSLAVLGGGAAPPEDPAAAGSRWVAAAVEAMGGRDVVAALGSLAVRADCVGPGGPFVTEVFWLRPDRTLMIQTSAEGARELLAVGERAWSVDGASRRRTELPPAMASMIHGHAFHPTLLELDRRFTGHRLAGVEPDGCRQVEMRDAAGRPAAVCLDPESRLPVRFSFEPEGPGGAIEMELSGWRRIGQLRYFTAFTLRQDDEVYTYAYDAIRPDAVETERLRPEAAEARPGHWQPGTRISLSLKDADLREVLRSFARLGGFNLVLDPSVRGSVTVELQDVPWEQALEVILKANGLGAEVDGKAWRVRPR